MTITDKADFKAKVRASMRQLQNDPRKNPVLLPKTIAQICRLESAFTYGLINKRRWRLVPRRRGGRVVLRDGPTYGNTHRRGRGWPEDDGGLSIVVRHQSPAGCCLLLRCSSNIGSRRMRSTPSRYAGFLLGGGPRFACVLPEGRKKREKVTPVQELSGESRFLDASEADSLA